MFKQIDLTPPGLDRFALANLPPIVVLTGKNGSGKSRILRALATDAVSTTRRRREMEMELRNLEPLAALPSPPNVISPPKQRVERLHQDLNDLPLTSFHGTDCQVLLLDATQLTRVTPRAFASIGVAEFLQMADQNPSFAPAHVSVRLGDLLLGFSLAKYLDKHPDHKGHSQNQERLRRAENFNVLAQALLGTRVDYRIQDNVPLPTLFGRVFDASELSPGQLTLLTWIVCIHAQTEGNGLSDGAVIALDEPEAHLHPGACTEILDRLRRGLIENSNRQLWVATHSPAVLSHLYPHRASIYLVENGKIQRAARGLPDAMEQLLGKDGRTALHAFLTDAHSAEFSAFAAQCLTDALVSTRSDDRQSSQLVTVIRQRLSTGDRVRVLDYASGKGRFARALADLDEHTREAFEYFTCDDKDHDNFREEREENVRALYPNEDIKERCRTE